MDGAPPQIAKLVHVLEGLPGVVEVDCGAIPLEELDPDHLSLVPFGDLPHASLLRTSGGLPGEALGQFFIRFDRSDSAWTSIEFLSWQVRDCSRSGKRYQMRSLGLPPVIGNELQLGQSLRFVIELFKDGLDIDPESLLSAVDEFAEDIRSSLEIYSLEWCDDGITNGVEQGVDPNA